MNLIKQFPDVSAQIRNRTKWNQKSRNEKQMSIENLQDNDPDLVVFYDHEFKKWHYKVTLIIAIGIACIFSLILTASGIFQWIIMNRNSHNI